jgi:butyryl-CoA dehydrogenase
MDLTFTPEQIRIRDAVRDFAQTEVKPVAVELDRTGRWPAELIPKMGQLGLMGMSVPKELGGPGWDTVSCALAVEELSKVCPATAVIAAAHASLGTMPIVAFGTEEQKQRYVPRLARGEIIGCMALTEPEAGSDAANIQTTATEDGDWWVLNGTKHFIANGGKADLCVLYAITDPGRGHRGISTLIVEKGTPGFEVTRTLDKLGVNALPTSELRFENCRIPKGNLLGKRGAGFLVAMHILDGGRIGVAAQAVGIAQVCLEEAIEFAKTRVQFGGPIAKLQAIQWMLADMATDIEAARWLTYRVAWLKDSGARITKESSIAKLFASQMVNRVAYRNVQIHGGYGYMKDYPAERHFRDARITEIYEGTSEIQRLVIATQLLR